LPARLQTEHRLTHSILGDVSVSVYEADEGTAVALQYGSISAEERVLVRVHSACMYGEALLASDCDCREQLVLSFELFKEHGAGLLVYLSQEGRGAGLINKARSYALQDRGEATDTVDAYVRLQLDPDSRDYTLARDILMDLGVRKLLLLTNNYRKVEQLQKHDLDVTREPLLAPLTSDNAAYLRIKEAKLRHDLEVESRCVAD
jgi:3,4-dihydroxy 2-butanone 4-phosphate synthase / GTP cyclohydrolase II